MDAQRVRGLRPVSPQVRTASAQTHVGSPQSSRPAAFHLSLGKSIMKNLASALVKEKKRISLHFGPVISRNQNSCAGKGSQSSNAVCLQQCIFNHSVVFLSAQFLRGINLWIFPRVGLFLLGFIHPSIYLFT